MSGISLDLEPRTEHSDPTIYRLSLSTKCFVSFDLLAMEHKVHAYS